MNKLPKNKQIILFDGVCNLCNSSVQYVIKHDKKSKFMFMALQSNTANKLLKTHDIDAAQMDSILLYIPHKGIKAKSTAALKIAAQLNFPVCLLGMFMVVPKFFRDWVYNYIAKNRYKWFGKTTHCMIPTESLKQRFVD